MNNINKILGDNVRRHRKRLRMTQDQLAEKCEKSLGTIQLMESGKTWPELATIQILSKLFRIDDSELFKSGDIAATQAEPHSPDLLRDLLSALSTLDNPDMRRYLEMITGDLAARAAGEQGKPLPKPSNNALKPRKAAGSND